MTQVNNGSGGRPALAEDRARQLREMRTRSRLNELTRLEEVERSRSSGIEYEKKWDAVYAAMNLDDVIEIPCIENGKKVMQRFYEKGGKMIPIDVS